ncbi:MAG: VWA domain-containing protein [Desulfobacterium sp.]|nr:VWA domain-containing protein [Desulfobacterium sp.]
MIKNRHIMASLPMVASILGKKYGVNVEIGGEAAFTDGKTIQLPSLPLDCDETLIGLARGYIDHESAHIRETRFDIIKSANLTPMEMQIWNTFEDWRVETRLSKLFPGCRQNFNWLIRHLFESERDLRDCNPATEILNWLLLAVRAWDVPSLCKIRDQTGIIIDGHYPGLLNQLNSVLQKVRTYCDSTEDCILRAKEVASILKDRTENMEKTATESPSGESSELSVNENKEGADLLPTKSEEDTQKQRQLSQQLRNLLNAVADELPKNLGEILAEDLVNKAPANFYRGLQVAMIGDKKFKEFSPEELREIRKSSSALKTRLQSLMQAKVLKRSHIARQGKLGTHQLHKFAVSDPRVFVKHMERQGINTAVHILIDCSRSMHKRMALTTKACYAVAKALESVKGINVGVTAFPATLPFRRVTNANDAALYPIVSHGDPVHSRFFTKASGCTPMGEATWWVLQQMLPLTESRKIILILTDGDPDCQSNMIEAIDHGRKLGFEIYGIGIDDNAITALLPHHSCTIRHLSELAPAMFGIMKDAFINDHFK